MRFRDDEATRVVNQTILFWKLDPDIRLKYCLSGLAPESISRLARRFIWQVIQTAMEPCQESPLAQDWSGINIYSQIIQMEELTNEIKDESDYLIQSYVRDKNTTDSNYFDMVIYHILLEHLTCLIRDLSATNKLN